MHEVLEKIKKNSPHLSWLPERTVLLVRHGSHAYGTNNAASDEDFKGIAIPPKEYFLGSHNRFEQAELSAPDPDAVIYDLRKFFVLAADCNPNIIEVLHTDPSDHFLVDPIGEIILENKDNFLSKKIKFTFSGYAVAQLKRIKTHRRWLINPPQTPPTRLEMGLPEKTLIPQDQLMAADAEIRKELDKYQFDFMEHASDGEKVQLKSMISSMMAELKITSDAEWISAARRVGLDDNFIYLMQKEREYAGKKREWDQFKNWERTRNKARAQLEAKYGYDCYLDDTEFLTEFGWKKYHEINDIKLATLNQDSGSLEFQNFSERICKDYSGEIYYFETQDSACAVTPNHRMWVSPIRGGKNNKNGIQYIEDKSEWQIVKAEKLISDKRYSFHIRTGVNGVEDPSKPSRGLLILVGAYVSEGCVAKRTKSGPTVLSLSQLEGGRQEKYLEELNGLLINSKVHKYSFLRKNRCENTYTVYDPFLVQTIVAQCGEGSFNKRLPSWIKELSQKDANFLLDVLVSGDGTHRKYSNIYYTTSKQLADDVQTLAIISGQTSKLWGPYPDKRTGNSMYHVYISNKKKGCFSRLITRGKNSSLKIEKVKNRKIVCFTVPNEILITRRNGKVAIQGNTKHGYHLVRLIRMCREILTTGKVIVKRPDREELLAIRNGEWSYDRLVDWADAEDKELDLLYKTSTALPQVPDRKYLDNLCIYLVEKSLSKYSWYNVSKSLRQLLK